MKPEILHNDESIVIVSKPAGMLTIPDRFDKDFPNVRAYMILIMAIFVPLSLRRYRNSIN